MLSYLFDSSSSYVWEPIWQHDPYASSEKRARRAHARWQTFNASEILSTAIRTAEVACGAGDFIAIARNYLPNESHIVGIDRSLTALKRSRGRKLPNSLFACGDAYQLPLADSAYDAIFAFGIIEHLRHHDAALIEIHRCLKPNGIVFFSSSNALSFFQLKDLPVAMTGTYRYGYQMNWTPRHFKSIVSRHFDVERFFIAQCDEDAPVSKGLDTVMNKFCPSWGRYIHVVARKTGAPS